MTDEVRILLTFPEIGESPLLVVSILPKKGFRGGSQGATR